MSTKEALYKLLRIAIGNEEDLSLPEDVNLMEVIELSEQVGINGIAVSGYQRIVDSTGGKFSPTNKEDKQRLMTWIGLSLMNEQKTTRQWQAAQNLVDLYEQNGIITVGLKGVTIGQWYPNPMLRDSCDFDCILLKREADGSISFAYEEGNKVVEVHGTHVDRNIYVHSQFKYHELMVENHHFLSAVKLSKRHRRMDELLRSLLLTEPLQPVMDSKLTMGSPMFNAVFLTHHAHRHFLGEYMPLKLLMDWALFIRNNQALDWLEYWRLVDDFGMLRFAQSITRLSCRLLGANVPFNLPEDAEADSLLEVSLWELPKGTEGPRSLLSRRLSIITNLLHARRRYKVFYDTSPLRMIIAYVNGFVTPNE